LVLAVSAAGSLVSALWMAYLYRSGADLSRLYYGTDTHAQSLLCGCALAAFTASVPIRMSQRLATGAAAGAAGALGWAACSLGNSDAVSYQGGFLLVSILAALLVAVVVAAPSSPPARVLSFPPLAYIGRISYGMYLWYFPLFAVVDRASTGLAGAELFLVRCATDVGLAAISFHLIEQPIRGWRPRLRLRIPTRLRVPTGIATLVTGAGVALLAAGFVVVSTQTDAAVAPPVAFATQNAITTSGNGTRILVFGDSTAATLGDDLALSEDAQQHRIVVDVVGMGMFGCGLVTSVAVSLHGQVTTPPVPCRVGSPPQDRWPALLQTAISSFRPDVALVVTGRWEVDSRQAEPGGPWLNITETQDAAYVRSQLEVAASIVVDSGAHLAIATAPCFSSGEQPNGNPWPEDSAKRLNAYNSLVRQVTAQLSSAHPGAAAVVDLESMVCPAGKFHTVIDGVTVRAPDGIHYPFINLNNTDASADTFAQAEAFGSWIEPKILREATNISR
jgi:peptidoglycan/LPS O-acetylase OafA/YrhL